MSDAELDNKSNDDKAPNYWREKALHEKAKRELAELDLKLKQDQLVEVDQVALLMLSFPLIQLLQASKSCRSHSRE
jgi:hypothetical protein